MSRIAIIAALPGELKPLVRGWTHAVSNGVRLWRRRVGGNEWIAACAGVGVEAATRAFAEIEKGGAIDAVFSVGWAGALRNEFVPGQAYCVAGVIDAQTGERFRVVGGSGESWLATGRSVADQAEKRRLASALGAGLVDMEASGIARQAAARGIPFYCVKGVSDGVTDRLPDFNRFISATGRFESSAFILFALLRPWFWPGLMRLGVASKKAAHAIRRLVLVRLEEQETVAESRNRRGPQP
jgi:adenosylhomocysteine nucleosidase